MKTVAQLRSSIISQVWPSGQPEGLETAHALLFQEGLALISKWIGEEMAPEDGGFTQNVDIRRFCKTQYKCGMTVLDAPRGIIRRVFTICNDEECDPVYYKQVKWPGPEWLGKRAMIYAGTDEQPGGTAIRMGFSEASADNDARCGRARAGVWALHRGNLYLSPWIQSTEKVVIEWDGIKTEWSDDDPVNEDQDYRAALKMFYQYAHERDYGSLERAMAFHNAQALRDPSRAGAFDLALADLMKTARDRVKVRATDVPDDPFCLLDSTFDRCLPPDTATPLLLGHIGNYGIQGFGEELVATLMANMGLGGILACGAAPDTTYDISIGQYFHSLIFPYGGEFGDPASANAYWPAPSAEDWALNDLDDFKAFFTLPNNERYYDVCLGAIHLFVVDSNADDPDGITDTSAQAQWLKAKLALSTSPWKIVLMSNLLTWPFGTWGADMVLATAAGYYERTEKLDIPIIVNGLGGNEQTGGAVVADADSRFIYQRGLGYGAGRIIATRCSLRYEMVLTSGELIDSVQINKAATGECAEAVEVGDLTSSTINDFLPPTSTSSGSGIQQVFQYAGNPNGNVLAGPLPSVCLDTLNNITWSKTDGIRSNTGWV